MGLGGAEVCQARVICPYFALDEGEIGLKKGAEVDHHSFL